MSATLYTLQNKFQSGTLNISNVLDSYQRNNYLPKYQQKLKDNCFLLNDLSIAFVKVKHNDGTLECDVINQRYVDSLYSLPTDSKTFNVYLLTSKNRNKNEERILRIEDFQKKCVCLPERRGLAIFALLHNTERY